MTVSDDDKVLDWSSIPSAETVYRALREQVSLQAKIRLVTLEIQLEEARISQKKPRDKMIRVVGLEDSPIIHRRYELVSLQDALDSVNAELRMFEFRKEIFKTLSFKERY